MFVRICSQTVWKIINELSGKKRLYLAGQVKTKDGDIIHSTEQLLEEWRDYFQQLLNNHKAPGCDTGITAEALNYGGNVLAETLLDICNQVFETHIPPTRWRTNLVIPLTKKGDLSLTKFQGITLMSIGAKLYNRLLLNRIRDLVDPKLGCNQVGFRKGVELSRFIWSGEYLRAQ